MYYVILTGKTIDSGEGEGREAIFESSNSWELRAEGFLRER